MHSGEALPVVGPETAFAEVVYEMSRKGFGVTAVTAPTRPTDISCCRTLC